MRPVSECAIRADRLVKRYGSRVAVDHLSFTVPTGSITGVCGPNGSGKTTTFRMLVGLARPDGGSAEVLGYSMREPGRYLPGVGALIEEPAFHPRLSARQSLQVLARLGGVNDRRVDQVIERAGLDASPRATVGTLSLGNRQRLAIAAALLRDPVLLILDEPGNALDAIGLRDLRRFLTEFAGDGGTVLISSHLLSQLEQLCGHVLVLQHGRSVYEGSLDGLLGARTQLVLRPENNDDLAELAQRCRNAGHDVDVDRHAVRVHAGADSAGPLNRLAMEAGITLVELRAEADDLEAALVGLVGSGPLAFVAEARPA